MGKGKIKDLFSTVLLTLFLLVLIIIMAYLYFANISGLMRYTHSSLSEMDRLASGASDDAAVVTETESVPESQAAEENQSKIFDSDIVLIIGMACTCTEVGILIWVYCRFRATDPKW